MSRVRHKSKSKWEQDLWFWLELEYPGEFIAEYRFHPKRMWRFDFACVHEKFAVEIDGIVYRGNKGGHQTPKGMERDREKDAEAMILGWKVLRITPKMMRSGLAYVYIERLLRRGGSRLEMK